MQSQTIDIELDSENFPLIYKLPDIYFEDNVTEKIVSLEFDGENIYQGHHFGELLNSSVSLINYTLTKSQRLN